MAISWDNPIERALARLNRDRATPRSVPRYEPPESAEPQVPPCSVCAAMLVMPALRNLFLLLEHECPKAESPERNDKRVRDTESSLRRDKALMDYGPGVHQIWPLREIKRKD